MAETGSSRKSRNKEFEEVHLCTTLNDYVAIGGLRKQSGGAFLGRCVDETYLLYVNTGDEVGHFSQIQVGHQHQGYLNRYPFFIAQIIIIF